MAIDLRDYQVNLLEGVRDHMRAGKRRIIAQATTGAGKGRVIAKLAELAHVKKTKTLLIADRRKLVDQLAGNLGDISVPHGVIMAGRTCRTNEGILVASRDTFKGWFDNPDLSPPDVGLICVDECRLSLGDGFQYILNKYPKAFVVGFDATPVRTDGKALESFWQAMVCAAKTSDLIRRGFLMQPTVYEPPELAAKRARGEKTRGLAGDPVFAWVTHARDLPTIAACSTVDESIELMQRFLAAGIAAEHVDADSSDEEREAKYARLKTGRTKVLCSVDLLITGVDIPEVACCIIWRAMGSLSMLFQFGGRAMRPAPGKDRVVILDHSGACAFHKVQPGDDIEWSLDPAKTVQERIDADLAANPEKKRMTCPACGAMFKSAPACPSCGHVMKVRKQRQRAGAASDGYEAADEILVKRTAAQELCLTQEKAQRAWRKALYTAKAKGGRASMALHIFKAHPDSGGKTPWEAGVTPLPDGDWKIAAKDLLDMAKAGAAS